MMVLGWLMNIYNKMDNYKIESKKGEGTYSIVYTASNKETNEKYALKIMKHPYKDI